MVFGHILASWACGGQLADNVGMGPVDGARLADVGSGRSGFDASVPESGPSDVAVPGDAADVAVPGDAADGAAPDAPDDAPYSCSSGYYYGYYGGGYYYEAGTTFDAAPVDSGPPWDGGAAAVFASDFSQSPALAADDTYLYWADPTGYLWDCPLSGCVAAPTMLAAYANWTALTAHGGRAYFPSALSQVDTCAATGCSSSPTSYAALGAYADAGYYASSPWLASDPAHVYFTEEGALFSCPVGATCGAESMLVGSGVLGPLAVSSSEVFYAPPSPGGSIFAVPIVGGTPRLVCAAPVGCGINSMAVAGGYVYFTNGTPGVFDCPIASGSASTFVSDTVPASAVTTDSTSVYWTSYAASGSVGTCAAGKTCAFPRSVASGQNFPTNLVVTVSAVYWAVDLGIAWAHK